MTKYILREKHTIGEYASKKEAEADKENNAILFPESDFELIKIEE